MESFGGTDSLKRIMWVSRSGQQEGAVSSGAGLHRPGRRRSDGSGLGACQLDDPGQRSRAPSASYAWGSQVTALPCPDLSGAPHRPRRTRTAESRLRCPPPPPTRAPGQCARPLPQPERSLVESFREDDFPFLRRAWRRDAERLMMDAAAQQLFASGASTAASYSQCSEIRVRQRITEQPLSLEALWPCSAVNAPKFRRVSLSDFNVHGPRLVLGSTGYKVGRRPPLPGVRERRTFGPRPAARSDEIHPQVAKVGIHPVTMVTGVNGVRGADGAYLLDGNPPISWNEERGSDLEAHRLCVEIGQSSRSRSAATNATHPRPAPCWAPPQFSRSADSLTGRTIRTPLPLTKPQPTPGGPAQGINGDHRPDQREWLRAAGACGLPQSDSDGRSDELLQVRESRDGHKAGPRHSRPARKRIAGVPPPVGRACPVADVRRIGVGGSIWCGLGPASPTGGRCSGRDRLRPCLSLSRRQPGRHRPRRAACRRRSRPGGRRCRPRP